MATSRPFSFTLPQSFLEQADQLDALHLNSKDPLLHQFSSSLSSYSLAPEDLLSIHSACENRPQSAVFRDLWRTALDITTGLEAVDERLLLCPEERTLALLCLESPEISRRKLAYSEALKRLYRRIERKELSIAVFRRREQLDAFAHMLLLDRCNLDILECRAQLEKLAGNAREWESKLRCALANAGVNEQETAELLEGWDGLRLCDCEHMHQQLDPASTPLVEIKAFLWLARVRGSYASEEFNRRVFPLPVAQLLTSPEQYQDQLLRAAFPDFLLYLEFSLSISREAKGELQERYAQVHMGSLNDYLAELLTCSQPHFVTVFTRSKTEDLASDYRFKSQSVYPESCKSTSISSNPLLKFLTDFVNDDTKQVCFVQVFEQETLETAKTAAEIVMSNLLGRRSKVVCLVVYSEVPKQLFWNERWIHYAFNDPSNSFNIAQELDFPDLGCEEKAKTLLQRYFYSPGYSGRLSQEERCQVLTTSALLQALLAKFAQIATQHGLTDWRYKMLAMPPSHQPFIPSVLAAYEETGFDLLVQIVKAIEQLQAFPSFFTKEAPQVIQALWTDALLALDLSAPLKEQTAGWKLKMPFTALEYEHLRAGYLLEPNTYIESFLEKSFIGRFADRLQHYPLLQDLYLEDLAALSLGESCFDPDFSVAVARVLVGPSSDQFKERISLLILKENVLKRLSGKCKGNPPSPYVSDLQSALHNALSQFDPKDSKFFVKAYFEEMEVERNQYLYTLQGNSFVAINCLTLQPEMTFSLLEKQEEARCRTALLLTNGLVLFTGGCIRWRLVLHYACGHSFTVSQRHVVHTGQLQQPRYFHGAIEVLGQVFIFGGQTPEKLTTAERLIGAEWKICGQMHYPRTNFNPCYWTQLVYLVGGYQPFMETFDPTTLEFTVVETEVPEHSMSLAIAKGESDLLVLYGWEWRLYHLSCSGGSPVRGRHPLPAVWSSCSPVMLPALGQVFILEETGKRRTVSWVNWNTHTSGSALVL